MRLIKLIPVLAVLVLAVMSISFAQDSQPVSASQPAQGGATLDKVYKVVAGEGDAAKDVGIYTLKATPSADGKKVEISEAMAMDRGGKKIQYASTVVYAISPSAAPESGTAETQIDGKTCMKGSVSIGEKTISYEGTGHIDKKTLEAIDPPTKFERKDIPRPEGAMIFQSVFAVVGPKILSKEGELDGVTFVEFPDDIGAPELINFKKGYKLVRGAADEKGQYEMKILKPGSDVPVMHVKFDKSDQMVEICSFGKVRFVEAKPAK